MSKQKLIDKYETITHRIRSFGIELLDAVVCLCIAFAVWLLCGYFNTSDHVAFFAAVYSAHRGTRWVFTKIDPVVDSYIEARVQKETARVEEDHH